MNIKSLEADVHLRFDLKDSELEEVARALRLFHNKARLYGDLGDGNPIRTVSIYKGGQAPYICQSFNLSQGELKEIGEGETSTFHRYVTVIEYSPPPALTRRLADYELRQLSSITTLPFSHRFAEVVPSNLNYFKGKWRYSASDIELTCEEVPPPELTILLSFYGVLDDQALVMELRDMVDNMYLPHQNQEGEWTNDFLGITGGPPTVAVYKKIAREMNPEAELEIIGFYNSVLDFVLRHEVTENLRTNDGSGRKWGEIAISEGFSMHDHIASSTAWKNGMHAPSLSIDARIPSGNPIPQAIRQKEVYVLGNKIPSMKLTYFPETFGKGMNTSVNMVKTP